MRWRIDHIKFKYGCNHQNWCHTIKTRFDIQISQIYYVFLFTRKQHTLFTWKVIQNPRKSFKDLNRKILSVISISPTINWFKICKTDLQSFIF